MDGLGLAVAWAVLGWVVGALGGYAARALVAPDLASDEPPPRRVAFLGPLGVDLAIQSATAISFGLLALSRGFGLMLLIYSLYAVALVLVFVIDARTRFVYNLLAYPAVVIGVVLTPFANQQEIWNGLVGALIGAGILQALRLVGRRGYGGQEAIASGDVTIAAMVGAMTGVRGVLAALFAGSVLGFLIFVPGIVMRMRGNMAQGQSFKQAWGSSTRIYAAFGPGLCLGALLMLLIAN